MEVLKEEVVKNNIDGAIWLRRNYAPSRYAKGGARPYLMQPQVTLLRSVLGTNNGDFLTGKEFASDSLQDAEASYVKTAKEEGYLK